MKKEELIKKWLDHNLNAEEQKAFEKLDDYKKLHRLDKHLKTIEAPYFDSESAFDSIKKSLEPNAPKQLNWLKVGLRIAAVVILALSIFYLSVNREIQITTEIAEHSQIQLPDQSSVQINANSTIAFNEWRWKKTRAVRLNGEAFFQVAKGKKFDVLTSSGIVSVLGTQFNVKHRSGIFDVTCFEGKVGVTHNGESYTLIAGESFVTIDGKIIAKEKEITTVPDWLHGESTFNSVPLKYVFSELKRQYKVEVDYKDVDTSRLFSGSFSNNNLDLALQSICVPLNLSYQKLGNTIILSRE